MEKTCKVCGRVKPITEFYKHASTADRLFADCKECWREKSKQYRLDNIEQRRKFDRKRESIPHRKQAHREYAKTPAGKAIQAKAIFKYAQTPAGKAVRKKYIDKWRKKYPHRIAAESLLSTAIAAGRVTKYPCWICGKTNVHGHHPDYDQPLNVVWLCPLHHKQLHKEAQSQT